MITSNCSESQFDFMLRYLVRKKKSQVIMIWIVMIWKRIEMRGKFDFQTELESLCIQSHCISTIEIMRILNVLFCVYPCLSLSLSGSLFCSLTEKKKQLNIQIVRDSLRDFVAAAWPQPRELYCLSVSLIQFPFYDNKFFIFVWKWKPTFNNLFCLQWIWCEVSLCLVRPFQMCCMCSAGVEHRARERERWREEPVIEKVRKHCFSDKGIALSTGMIYLVNISILFSSEVEQYHMCLESTWSRA